MTNEAFFNEHAKSGAVCLIGGTHLIDRGIKKAQKKLTPTKSASLFSHAFILSEKRIDGKWWLIESDLEFHSKQIKLGVQENRVDKYYNEKLFPNVAILDFHLSPDASKALLTEALNLVAGRGKYSLREILGVLVSFSKADRSSENILSQDNSFFCSAFVQHCYQQAGALFHQNISLKHITPEDIYNSRLQHSIQKIIREK